MQPRRLLRHSRRPADSFDTSVQVEKPASNLLNKIGNQNLLMKLIGICLQLSQDAGLSKEEISTLNQNYWLQKAYNNFLLFLLNRKMNHQQIRGLSKETMMSYGNIITRKSSTLFFKQWKGK